MELAILKQSIASPGLCDDRRIGAEVRRLLCPPAELQLVVCRHFSVRFEGSLTGLGMRNMRVEKALKSWGFLRVSASYFSALRHPVSVLKIWR
jgi:hypothetical protein